MPLFTIEKLERSELRKASFYSLLLASCLSLLYLIPYVINDSRYYFIGAMGHIHDTNIYFMWLEQIKEGKILLQNLYSTSEHPGILFNLFLFLTGFPAYLFGWSTEACYHISRFVGNFLLGMALYALISIVAIPRNWRLKAWLVTLFAAGCGWLFIEESHWDTQHPIHTLFYSAFGVLHPPSDRTIYEMHCCPTMWYTPLFSFSIAALLYALIKVMHFFSEPTLKRALCTACIVSVLNIIHPYDIVVIDCLSIFLALLFAHMNRSQAKSILIYTSIFLVIANAPTIYNYFILVTSPGLVWWKQQNVTTSRSFFCYLSGLGLPFAFAYAFFLKEEVRYNVKKIISVYSLLFLLFLGWNLFACWLCDSPSLYNFLHIFISPVAFYILYKKDLLRKDLCLNSPQILIFVWFASFSLLMYIPVSFQRRLGIAFAVPVNILFFAWLNGYYHAHKEKAKVVITCLLLFSSMTSLRCIGGGIFRLSHPSEDLLDGPYIPAAQVECFQHLKKIKKGSATVLCEKRTGNRVPRFTLMSPVIGGGHQTDNYYVTESRVHAFFSGRLTPSEEKKLLQEQRVGYVIYGPEEKRYDTANVVASSLLSQGWKTVHPSQGYTIFVREDLLNVLSLVK